MDTNKLKEQSEHILPLNKKRVFNRNKNNSRAKAVNYITINPPDTSIIERILLMQTEILKSQSETVKALTEEIGALRTEVKQLKEQGVTARPTLN